jgi:hypothetical protein
VELIEIENINQISVVFPPLRMALPLATHSVSVSFCFSAFYCNLFYFYFYFIVYFYFPSSGSSSYD